MKNLKSSFFNVVGNVLSDCIQYFLFPKHNFYIYRGSNLQLRPNIETDSIPRVVPRLISDMLVAYSTVPGKIYKSTFRSSFLNYFITGFASHRNVLHGTWYIQAICKVFMEHAHDTDVESLLKMVDCALSTLSNSGSKQTSSFENRGFKTCFFHPQLSQ